MSFTHLDDAGHARMVDVTAKQPTVRAATARGFVRCSAEVVAALRDGTVPKGDVLAVARIAGIQAAKRTPDLLPLAHVIGVHGAVVDLAIVDAGVEIEATVRTADRTGVEMEALTAVSVAALAIVDMVKGLDKATSIENVRITAKEGGGRVVDAPDESAPEPERALADESASTARRIVTAAPTVGAILLAGGRASRVDGAAKPLFDVGGQTLLARAVTAVTAAGARPIVVAAPDPRPGPRRRMGAARILPSAARSRASSRRSASRARGRPSPTGRSSSHATSLASMPPSRGCSSDILLVPADTDGVCLGDPSSRPQWLTGIYRTAALRRAAEAMPDGGRDAPVRALLDDLAITVIAVPGDLTDDVDTWEDLSRARAAAGSHPGTEEES